MDEKREIYESYSTNSWGAEAMKERNRRARELRKEGYTVISKTMSFMDLLRCKVYYLEAFTGVQSHAPFGREYRAVTKEERTRT